MAGSILTTRKKILVTGANGLLGKSIAEQLAEVHELILLDRNVSNLDCDLGHVEQGDILDDIFLNQIVSEHCPEIVIHCAGIAHQKIGSLDRNVYFDVNSNGSKKIALYASRYNANVRFIFLSSVSVYGESNLPQRLSRCPTLQKIDESTPCLPVGDYAKSKHDAEMQLFQLYKRKVLKRLDILRLAPVYDENWTLNIDRRVFLPKKIAYAKFGPATQMMSALALPNLSDFIVHILKFEMTDSVNFFNVCDENSYSFQEIINVFRASKSHRRLFAIPIPLSFVWIVTRIGSKFFPQNEDWWKACYSKLAYDLIYDNQRMLATGFLPNNSVHSIFR